MVPNPNFIFMARKSNMPKRMYSTFRGLVMCMHVNNGQIVLFVGNIRLVWTLSYLLWIYDNVNVSQFVLRLCFLALNRSKKGSEQ